MAQAFVTDPDSNLLPPHDCGFGHSLRRFWSLDPAIHFLNHGSYGATPRYVLAAQSRWREQMEAEPVRFMTDELPDALRSAGERLARFVGLSSGSNDSSGASRASGSSGSIDSTVTAVSKLAFTENATAGANAVMRSMRWIAGDRIVIANHAYPALTNTARYVAQRHGLTVVEANLPWPLSGPDAVVDAYSRALEGGARLAIIDHVFSPLAVVSPIEQIIPLCRAQGAQVLIDGAHAPAMLPLSIDTLMASGVDWYVGNCHKWLCAPKGCGFIVASAEGQCDLHPTVISNFYGEGFEREFAWTGTGDPTARLAVSAAIEFIEALGVERYRNALREMAREAAALIADAWGVEPAAPGEMFAAMVTLPLPVNEAATPEAAVRWRLKLLREHQVEVPIIAIAGRLHLRISAQVYNEMADYELLAHVIVRNSLRNSR